MFLSSLLNRPASQKLPCLSLILALGLTQLSPLAMAREKLFSLKGPVNAVSMEEASPSGQPLQAEDTSKATDKAPANTKDTESTVQKKVAIVPAITPIITPLKLLLPRDHKHHNSLNQIYEFDHKPLGNRIPVILIPGRAEEFQQNSWWRSMNKDARQNPDYQQNFKTYIFLYNSKDELPVQAKSLATELRKNFAQLPASQPLMLVSYSLGGVIAREVMADDDILNRVDTLMAIGVPFHGSPMFDSKWFTEYLNPPNRFAIRRFWDRANYHVYMLGKNNLQHGLKWDNFDGSKPVFKEEIKVGQPKIWEIVKNKNVAQDKDKVIAVITETPEPYTPYPNEDKIRSKMLVYAGYLENGFTETNEPPNPRRLPRYALKDGKGKTRQEKRTAWLSIPGKLAVSILPVYGFTVHSVFTYMNYQLAKLPTRTPKSPEGENALVYRYNDGAIPLSSNLFLPARNHAYRENLPALAAEAHVRRVRVFANLDHVDLGEYNLFKSKLRRHDVLHPEDGAFLPNKWLLHDLCDRAEKLRKPEVQVSTHPE